MTNLFVACLMAPIALERSAPRAKTLVPITSEKLTIGFVVNLTLVLIPA